MKKNIIVVLLLSFSIAIGQQVTISDAQKAARNYLRNYGYSDVSITEQFSYDRNNRPNIYVFNTDVKAWVMISGDYRATPVWAMGFDEYYDTLEVEQYISQHRHLPDIPSAAEVEQQGVDLGQMNALLLQKVEELTLYILDLQKQIDELNRQK